MAEARPSPQSEVVVHSGERIHSLLIGKHQLIGTAADREHLDGRGQAEAVDFSKFRFPDPIEPAKQTAMEPSQSSAIQRAQSVPRNYMRLRRDEPHLREIASYLGDYQTNHQRKTMMLHQELEEHFLQPLSRKLAQKTSGPEYEEFVGRKMRAVSAFDTRTRVQDTFLERLPEIPVLHCDVSDLTDPIKKYQKNAEREDKLTDLISLSTGQQPKRRAPSDRDTMNLKKWKILAETRFYEGREGKPPAKGKRIIPGGIRCSLPRELDQFDPPEPTAIKVRKSVPAASVDHLATDLH
jgi:hypothetical protein